MPTLDPSRTLLNPRFADRFTVIRRRQVVGEDGVVKTVQTSFPNLVGVITYASPNDLQRLPEEERSNQAVRLHTRFRLFAVGRDAAQNRYLPDLVFWNADYFIVKDLNRYSRYGAGFLDAICTSIDMTDNAASFLPNVTGQLDFSRPNQAANATLGARPC